MNKTAVILTKQEALALPPPLRPLCFRLPSKIYHDVFQAVGAASMCRSPRPSTEVFDTEQASQVAVDLCFNIAAELERMGLTFETIPKPDLGTDLGKKSASENSSQGVGEVVPEAGIEPATKGL